MAIKVYKPTSAGRRGMTGFTFEEIFDVTVTKVNTLIMPAKRGMRGRNAYRRSSQWKKAIVTLAAGEKLELFDL